MKKNEIRPGVIYAYQRGRGDDYDRPIPIVFLTGTDVLYTQASRYKKPAEPEYIKAPYETKPLAGKGWNSRDVGYAAVTQDYGDTCDPETLLKPTLDEFRSATNHRANIPGARFTLVTSLATIRGPYDQVLAEYNTRRNAARQQMEQDQIKRANIRSHAASLIDSFQAGFDVEVDLDRTDHNRLTITLDEAGKLLTLLESAHDRADA